MSTKYILIGRNKAEKRILVDPRIRFPPLGIPGIIIGFLGLSRFLGFLSRGTRHSKIAILRYSEPYSGSYWGLYSSTGDRTSGWNMSLYGREYGPVYWSTVPSTIRSMVWSTGVRFGVPEYRNLGVSFPPWISLSVYVGEFRPI
jgi:hypothetical protein